MSSFAHGFSYGMYYMTLIYKTLLSPIFVNHSSGMLPPLVRQYLTSLLECRRYVEPKVKRAKISDNLREPLNTPYCGQRHYVALKSLPLSEMVLCS